MAIRVILAYAMLKGTLIAVDIGNTNINFGIFIGRRIIRRFTIPMHRYTTRRLRYILNHFVIDDGIICSVVPRMGQRLRKDLRLFINNHLYYLGEEIRVPIKNLYRNPAQVGPDRLVNAFAGIEIYGAPLIVVDFGTAVTFDVISKEREYLGGLILPGLEISLNVLSDRTALLPRVKLQRPKELIGRDTEGSMLSGVIYGFAALTDELIGRLKRRIGRRAHIIGTGGNIHLIKDYCSQMDKIDKDLTIKGLNLIYYNYK